MNLLRLLQQGGESQLYHKRMAAETPASNIALASANAEVAKERRIQQEMTRLSARYNPATNKGTQPDVMRDEEVSREGAHIEMGQVQLVFSATLASDPGEPTTFR